MSDTSAYEANYFFRDYVSEDITSYCIGDVYLYHYKETLIGVRTVREKKGFFTDMSTVPQQHPNYAPTIDKLAEAHIQECIDEIDHSDEKTEMIPLSEMQAKAMELLSAEIALLLDKKFLGET